MEPNSDGDFTMVLSESSIPTPQNADSPELTSIEGLLDQVNSATVHDIAVRWMRELGDSVREREEHPQLRDDKGEDEEIQDISDEQAENIIFGVLGAKAMTSLVSRAHFGPISEQERSLIYIDALSKKLTEGSTSDETAELPIVIDLSEALSKRASTSSSDDTPPIAS